MTDAKLMIMSALYKLEKTALHCKVYKIFVFFRMMLIVLLMMSYSMILVINGSRTYLILQADLQRGNHQEQLDIHIFVTCSQNMRMHC